MRLKTGFLAAASAMVMAGSAMAADLAPIAPPPPPAPVPAPAFSWNGVYIGAYGGYWYCCGGFSDGMAGVIAGYNREVGDHFLVGLDLSVGFYDFTAPALEAYAIGRAGFLIGPRSLIYGGFGIGWSGPIVAAATAGIEAAVTDNVIIRGETIIYDVFNSPDIGFRAGATFKFGGM